MAGPFIVPDSDRIPSQPGLVVEPLPQKPGEPKTTYRTLSADEVKARGLPPGSYQLSSEGKVDKIGDMPKIDQDLSASIKSLGLEEWLKSIADARELIKGGWATGIRGKLGGIVPGSNRQDFLGTLEGLKGAAILEKLQALRDQSKTGASGMGSLTEQEGERLASSIGALNPNMSGDQLLKNLDVIERHARSLQAIGAGKDPNDPAVQQEFGIGGIETPTSQAEVDQPQLAASNGETRSVIDPKKQALGNKIVTLMSKGADRNTIMGFAVGADPTLRNDPKFRAWVDEALRIRKPGMKFSVSPEFYTTEQPLSATEKGLNTVGQTGLGAGAVHAADAITAGNLDKLTGDPEGTRRALAASAALNPTAAFLGDLTGSTTAMMAGEGGLARLGMARALPRQLLADATYGGVSGGTNSDDPLTGALTGAAIGGGGSLAGSGVTKFLGNITKGVTNPAVRAVAAEDVPLTIGQAVGQSGTAGKIVKGLEDRMSGFSGVGDQIKARRLEGLQKMNAKAFDRALEPIGVKGSGKFGEEAVAEAQDQVSQAFNRALSGKAAGLDQRFIVEAAKAKNAIEGLPDRVNREVESSVDEVVNNYFDDNGQISGENMQALLRELGQIKRSYSGDPLGHRIGKAVDQVADATENLFRRQAPEVMPQYDAAKKAFSRLSTLEDAVLRGKNTGGVFTPAQLGMADRANTVKYGGKHAAAAGKGEFHEFQRNMQDVLPSQVPDPGTAGRLATLAVPGLIAGSGAGLGYAAGDPQSGAGVGLGLAGLLALAYSRGGQRALTSAALKRGKILQTTGTAIQRSSRVVGHATGGQASLESSRD